MLGNVIDQESTNGPTVVSASEPCAHGHTRYYTVAVRAETNLNTVCAGAEGYVGGLWFIMRSILAMVMIFQQLNSH